MLTSRGHRFIRSFLNFPHIRINPFARPPCASSLYETGSCDQSSAPISLIPSAMGSERHPIRPSLNPIRSHIRINPRNPQGYRSFNSGERGMEQQESNDERKQIDDDDTHTPAIVTCAILRANDYGEPVKTALHFSTFNSNGALLKIFSVVVPLHQPKMMSACRNLIFFSSNDDVLCDIATQESIYLPCINNQYVEAVGFGYVASTEEFKVLGEFFGGFKVLTLGTDQWRDVEDPPLLISKPPQMDTGGAFANGAIHFPTTTDQTILSFHLEREEWGWTAGPPVSSYHFLRELSGYLCVLSSRSIWRLDTNSGTWIPCTCEFADHIGCQINPLAIEHDGRVVFQFMSMRSDTEDSLLLYDPETKSTREIQSFHTPISDDIFYIKVFSSLGHRWNI